MKYSFTAFIFLIFVIDSLAQKPIMLDNIHYYVSDTSQKKVATDYFKTFFNGREMMGQPTHPLAFIDFVLLRPDEATFNISSIDQFFGIQNIGSQYKKQEEVKLDAKNRAMYGVHWVAINTKNIKKTVKKLLKAGYDFAVQDFSLPTEPDINAVAMWGFDNNIFVLVERPKLKAKTPFGVDHLQLLVKNLEDNVKFYQDVLSAEVLEKSGRSAVLKICNHKFVLSEPEVLGFSREQVAERDTNKFVANIDHLGFLYDDIEPAFYAAKANNYNIIIEPKLLIINDKPTPYTFCILNSPDNLQIELEEEVGRLSGRKLYKEIKNNSISK